VLAHLVVEDNVAQRMAGRVIDVEHGLAQAHPVAAGDQFIEIGDLVRLAARPDDTRAERCLQLGNGLDMVDMVMRDEDIAQRPAAMYQRSADGRGLRRIDGRSAAAGCVMHQIAEIVAPGRKYIDDQTHGGTPKQGKVES
jgi:hypothetical protein